MVIVLCGLVAAGIASSVAGGARSATEIGAIGGRASPLILLHLGEQWMLDPGLGPLVITMFAAGMACERSVVAGMGNRKAFSARSPPQPSVSWCTSSCNRSSTARA